MRVAARLQYFKILPLILISVLVLVFVAQPSRASFAKHPVCSQATPKLWKASETGCRRALKSGLAADGPSRGRTTWLCTCVADQLVNKLSCRELSLYTTNPHFSQRVMAKVVAICQRELKRSSARKRAHAKRRVK